MGLVPPPPVPPLPVVPCVVLVPVVSTELVPPTDVLAVGLPVVPDPVVVGPAVFPVLLLVGPALLLAAPVVPAVVPPVTGPATVLAVVPLVSLLALLASLPLELLFESSLLHAATIRATVTEEKMDARVKLSLDIDWSVYRTHNAEQGAGGVHAPRAFAFSFRRPRWVAKRERSAALGTEPCAV